MIPKGLIDLIGNPWFYALAIGYYVFMAAVQALDEPNEKDGRGYRFFYKFLHLVSANLKQAVGSKLPGAGIVGISVLLVALLIFPAFAHAQSAPVQVSFSAQNSAVTKKITGGIPSLKGLMMYQYAACNSAGATVSIHPGLIYQAAQKNKISPVGPEASEFLFRRVENYHPIVIATRTAEWVTGVVGILTSTDTLAMSSVWRGALPLIAQGAKLAGDKLQGQPDFSALQRSLISDQIALPPGTCRFGIMFATAGPTEPVFAEVNSVVVPAPAPPAQPMTQPEVKP